MTAETSNKRSQDFHGIKVAQNYFVNKENNFFSVKIFLNKELQLNMYYPCKFRNVCFPIF